MDQEIVDRLEREIEQAIARLGRNKLLVVPSHQTVRMMAKAAVAVSEAVADECRPEDREP
jgi:hypothetical protein